MARYLLLLHAEDCQLAAMQPDRKQALYQQFVTWSETLKAAGVLQAVESLMDSGGTTLRKKRDALIVDGPYAELHEMVGGLFVLEAAGVDAIHALAAECPLLAYGGAIEVREIALFPVRP